MEQLKIGQRIEIVEILTDGQYSFNVFTPGTFRPRTNDRCVLSDEPWNKNNDGRLMLDYEIKPVGAMIIKSLKQ